jgi:hypothetical protein
MAFLDNLNEFLQSPAAVGFASGLLESAGSSSNVPIGFAQALGHGLAGMQAGKAQDLENKYRQSLTAQALLQNQQAQNKLENQKKITEIIGHAGLPPTQVPFREVPGTGSGYLGGQISQEDAQTQIAGLLAQNDPKMALTLLGANPKNWSSPIQAVGEDGQVHYIQVDNTTGKTRELPGYTPLPKTGMSLTYDPVSHTMNFTQGPGIVGTQGSQPGEPIVGSNNGPVAKDPTKSPAKGGQGGTYTDLTTGRVYSSNTPKQTVQDQATVAAIQRLTPMVESITNNLPQFQSNYVKTKAYLQGIANKNFGTDFTLPTEKQEGISNLNAAPDPLLRIMGLPSTDEGIKTVRGILEPGEGESPKNYKERVLRELAMFQKNYSGAALDRLENGITLREGNQVNNQNVDQQQTPSQTKTLNGKNYIKIGKDWFEQ